MTDVARQTLSGNDVHSIAMVTALKCATSISLSGNEFRLQDTSFRRVFACPCEGPKSRFLVAWLLGMTRVFVVAFSFCERGEDSRSGAGPSFLPSYVPSRKLPSCVRAGRVNRGGRVNQTGHGASSAREAGGASPAPTKAKRPPALNGELRA